MKLETMKRLFIMNKPEPIPSKEAKVQIALGIKIAKCPRCNRYWKEEDVMEYSWSGWNPAKGNVLYNTYEYCCWYCQKTWREFDTGA